MQTTGKNVRLELLWKKSIKDNYDKEWVDKFSAYISKTIAELKQFPDMGTSMREKYNLDCDYYMMFIEYKGKILPAFIGSMKIACIIQGKGHSPKSGIRPLRNY